MPTYNPLMSELQAVNFMLLTIGESPISSIASAGNLVEATIALQILENTTREILMTGWHFNTQKNFTIPITKNQFGTFLEIPNMALRCDPVDPTLDYIEQITEYTNTKTKVKYSARVFFDRINSFDNKFTSPCVCEVVFMTPFEKLPQPARHLITTRSSRLFQDRVLGSDVIYRITVQDEQQAFALLKKTQLQNGDYNIYSNYSSMRILAR